MLFFGVMTLLWGGMFPKQYSRFPDKALKYIMDSSVACLAAASRRRSGLLGSGT